MITTLHGAYRPVKGFIQFPNLLKAEFEKLGGEVQLKTEVKQILIEKGMVKGVVLENNQVLHAEMVVSTADTKVTFEQMIGHDTLKLIDKKYAAKVQNTEMSPSAFTIHLGLDDYYNLKELGFDCGYNVLTTGRATHEKMFDIWEKNEIYLSDNEFHMAVISPSVKTGGKHNLIIRVVPFAAQKWIDLRASDYQRYCEEKEKVAEFYIKKVEQYMLPELRKHILFKDISSPATYARYIHTPTGSNYDMMPVPGNFGKNRLKTQTPIANLYVPKFSHGIWPSMQAGLQVVDMISGGKIMHGNSRYSKPTKK
jgi:phytoene dehydrogenase-like protein